LRNRWIAVAEKVGVVKTAVEFFKKHAGAATGRGAYEAPS
jgi:hypothetical protein